jgi:amidohydrolase
MSKTRLEFGKLLPEAIITRHDLHAHPELGYQEHRTSEIVQRRLSESKVKFTAGLAGGTGVLAYLPSTRENAPTVALRADMDALPIVEETELPYSSTHKGRMHACGHDGHTTILLTTAKLLTEIEDRPNNVLFIFQPAEEGGAGAKKMRDEGVLSGLVLGKPADYIFGLHGHPAHQLGHLSTRVGPLMAAACQMKITVHGKGAHAAYPHLGIDPIVVAAHIVTALQTVASRSVNPLESVVVTIGKIEAGMAHNVIPESATLAGTLRTLNEDVNSLATARIERLATSVAEAFGATATVKWEAIPYPVTLNDRDATEKFRAVATPILAEGQLHDEPHPSMGGEDFSFYGQHVPACFFFLGLKPESQAIYPNLHSPRFDFNDDAIGLGVEIMSRLALQNL